MTTEEDRPAAEMPPWPQPLCRSISFEIPERLSELSAWNEHTPFAMWLVDAHRPRSIVELGTHSGVSICAFAQAVKALALPSACYAVDTWEGDAHTNLSKDAYATDIFGDLRRHHNPRYGSFSTLIRSTFDDAVSGFADGSIDLLHIDGYHTYEAVRGDFETWAPKLSTRAVVLFHDINERGGTFGAWRFWDEIRARYPSFQFHHGHGLGVLAVGPEQPEPIHWLTGLDDTGAKRARSFFAARGHAMQALVDLEATDQRWQAAEALAAKVANEHEATRGELASAHQQLQEADLRAKTDAAARQAMLDAAQQRIAHLEVETNTRTHRIGALEAVQAQLRGEIQAARDHARYLDARIRGFEGSTSWRLTRPLRLVGRLVRWLSPLLRWRRHKLKLSPCAPVENADTSIGPITWYEASSSQGSLPTRWVAIRYGGTPPEGATFLTLYVDHAAARWEPMPLPVIRGKAETHLMRLPDAVTAMRVGVWTSRKVPPVHPGLAVRELGQIELALRMLWRNRRRLPNAIRHLKNFGLAKTLEKARGIRQQVVDHYPEWVRAHDTLTDADRTAIRKHVGELSARPLISVVVPVYNTPERYLRGMLDSVIWQLYPEWELCIADDASTEPHVRTVLQEYAERDSRIKLTFRETNGHISAASNSALELASGGYVALLDHDDMLTEHALYMIAVAINEHPDADLFYSDEDKINGEGERFGPYFKPDFGLELILGQNYVSHLGVYRLDTIRAVGGFRVGYEGSQDYDLMLRVVDQSMKAPVHLPWILYHWRIFPGAGTFSSNHINKAAESARKAVLDHMARRSIEGSLKPWAYAWHIVVRDDPPRWPKVSIVVPTRDRLDVLKTCLDDVLERTDYPDIEIIVANNDSREPRTLEYFETLRADARVRILDIPGPFNFSAINNAAVRVSSGEIILLLNNDIEVIDGRWLKEMVKQAIRPEVGAVGAKLLYPDNTVQHGGVVLGLAGIAAHLHVTEPASSSGYYGWLRLPRNVSATTAACLALRRSVFDEVGGFDEVNLKVAFNDVDLCLKITEKGYAIIWTPEATLYHWESKSRGHDTSSKHFSRFQTEADYMRSRWGKRLERDPFFNPNLSLESTHPIVAFPPRVEQPWRRYLGSSTEAS